MSKAGSKPDDTTVVSSYLKKRLSELVSDDSARAAALASTPPAEVKDWIDTLCERVSGRRDAALTMLGFPVALGRKMDITDRIDGDRTVSNRLGKVLDDLKIPAVASALQNSSFRHGFTHARITIPEGGYLHEWASEQGTSLDEIETAFSYLAAKVASTARDIPEMAKVEKFSLTFERCVYIIDELLETPSNGAYPQFLFAGWLQALVESRATGQRVVTKGLYSTDASAGTAADVQVVQGQANVLEAFEVSDRDWQDKVDQAVEALNAHGLDQVTIVATGTPPDADALATALSGKQMRPATEICVLDLRSELVSMVRQVHNPVLRLRALEHTYHFLSEEADPQLMRDFNRVLDEAGVAA